MKYPITNQHFQVAWGGQRIGFTEISGLSIQSDALEFSEGTFKTPSPIKMPGILKYQNLILKRHLYKGDNEMYEWFQTIHFNQVERRDITISLLNESHEPMVVWKVSKAFPVKIDWSDLNANDSSVMIETIEVAYDSLQMEMF